MLAARDHLLSRKAGNFRPDPLSKGLSRAVEIMSVDYPASASRRP
jgi:hypothetical protein